MKEIPSPMWQPPQDIEIYIVAKLANGEFKKLKLNEKQEELFDEMIAEYETDSGWMIKFDEANKPIKPLW